MRLGLRLVESVGFIRLENRGQQQRSDRSKKSKYIRPHPHEQTNLSATVAQDLSKSMIWYS